MEDNNLIIYKNSDGNIIVDAIYKDETLWLSQKGMSKVFECSTDNISLHLKHIFQDNELNKDSVTEKCSLTADDGKKYNTTIYSLDAIIAVGYRVNSKKATEFRIWATKILKEYMTKRFALNDERFIKGNKYDSKYFDELLERIKTIRVSERMSYQKITDLFIATSTDYNPKSEEAYLNLKELSNNKCTAYTGITLIDLYKEKTICSSSKADVYFNEIKDEEIERYVNNEEKIFKCCGFVPLGKASLFIDKIEGDYNTLLGISPSIIYNKLKELGYSVTDFNFEKRK